MPAIRPGTLSDGTLKGADYGASISLILDESEPGQGPRLRRHPYDETWVVLDGHLTFQSGEEVLVVGAGDIVLVPPGVAHKFTQQRPGTLEADLYPRQPDVHRRMAGVTPQPPTGSHGRADQPRS
ncbi:MAG: cupin domain-containing protein [Solirubrobacteraceae bacterium]